MDPNLYHLDWERLFEVLATAGVMAILIERALAILFEWRPFYKKFDKKGVKEPITLVVSFIVCRYWDFDAVSMIILRENTSIVGQLLTAGILSGGAKGSVRLFRDIWGWRSKVYDNDNPRKK